MVDYIQQSKVHSTNQLVPKVEIVVPGIVDHRCGKFLKNRQTIPDQPGIQRNMATR
jgi:hypothetical protein